MITGIGVDIVEISRMEDSLSRLGDAFAKRILTSAEWEAFDEKKMQARYLAKRFAAKEAAVKALGTGFSQGISMKHINVFNDDLGKPCLEFTETAKSIADQRNVKFIHLSIADEKEYAVAYVVLEA